MVEEKRLEIKHAMASLGRKMAQGVGPELLYWIIQEEFACAHRPLRYHRLYGGSRAQLPPAATDLVFEWVAFVRDLYGVKSILSLMHDGDLRCYRGLDLGTSDLLEFFERERLVVARHPYEDPAHKSTHPAEARNTLIRIREEAWKSYAQLPKPVLIQCSAGEDRSAPVAAFIYAKRVMA